MQFAGPWFVNGEDWRDCRAEWGARDPVPVRWRSHLWALWPVLPGLMFLAASGVGWWVRPLGMTVMVAGYFYWVMRYLAVRYRARRAAAEQRPCPLCGQGGDSTEGEQVSDG